MEGRWSQGAGQGEKRRSHSRPHFRSAQPRLPGLEQHCFPAWAPSILTPPPASRRHSPNRNRLLYEGVSGRARNAKPGNRREPEPPPQYRKNRWVAAEEEGGAGGQRAELTRKTPAQCGEALRSKGASKTVVIIFLFPFQFGLFLVLGVVLV